MYCSKWWHAVKYYLSSVQQKSERRINVNIEMYLPSPFFRRGSPPSHSIQMHIHNSCHVGMGIEKLDLTRRRELKCLYKREGISHYKWSCSLSPFLALLSKTGYGYQSVETNEEVRQIVNRRSKSDGSRRTWHVRERGLDVSNKK